MSRKPAARTFDDRQLPSFTDAAGRSWSRRALLLTLGGTALGLACRSRSPAPGARFDGFPIHELDGFLTPATAFFIRDHFGVPARALTAPEAWTVTVEGEVERPLTLKLPELAGFSRVDLPVTLECADNAGRNGLGWPGAGRAWVGASTATFQGCSLPELLRQAGLRSSAREVVFEGADEGVEAGEAERHAFARSVPLEAALEGNALLATGMNGAVLPPLHGGPLRAVLPGRYATDSVKWVQRIRVVSAPFEGFYQVHRYRRASREDPAGAPLGRLRVQAEIVHPQLGARLPQGLAVDVTGVAWGGSGGLARVEVSVDGGRSFHAATFLDPDRPTCWRRWRWTWQPTQPGPRLVLARATDVAGHTQPLASEEELGQSYSISGRDRIQYANNAAPIIPVTVV